MVMDAWMDGCNSVSSGRSWLIQPRMPPRYYTIERSPEDAPVAVGGTIGVARLELLQQQHAPFLLAGRRQPLRGTPGGGASNLLVSVRVTCYHAAR